MQQQAAASTTLSSAHQPLRATAIAQLSRQEVIPLAREELTRFLPLVESLAPDDWSKPTDCALWTVKDVVAHQASHVLALTHVREFIDQFNPLRFREYTRRGMNILDAANQRQVDRRAHWTPQQLIAEIRDNGEASLVRRQQFPALFRRLPVRTPGYEGAISMGALIDNIFTRDMWMHRLDIYRATGRSMPQTADHDARLTALVVRELDQYLSRKLNGRAVVYSLTGEAGGAWIAGSNAPPEAEVSLDVLDFHRLASGRISAAQALEQGLIKIDGDQALGTRAVENTIVLY